jgi:hypothetical protein
MHQQAQANYEPNSRKFPVGRWFNRMNEIPYNRARSHLFNGAVPLMDRHPVINGILFDVNGRVVSIEILVPNKHSYEDQFFYNNGLIYVESNKDLPGNYGLSDAAENGDCFRIYAGYKSGEPSTTQLKNMGVPQEFHAKSFDLGLGIIRQTVSPGKYLITPASADLDPEDTDYEKVQEYINTNQWNVKGKDGKIKIVQSVYE